MSNEENDFFAELNAELATHMAKGQMRKDAASAKKTAMSRAVSEVARLAAMRQWKELQAILDVDVWRPTASIALFVEQSCDGCGSIHRVFLQHMEQQVLRTKPSTKRFVRVGTPEITLPKAVLVQEQITHMCSDCCDDHGFDFNMGAPLDVAFSIGISPTYEQGDINGTPEAN